MFENKIKQENTPELLDTFIETCRLIALIAAEKLKKNPRKNSFEFRNIVYDSIEEHDKAGKLKLYEKEKYCNEVGKLLRMWSQAALHENKLNCEEKDYE